MINSLFTAQSGLYSSKVAVENIMNNITNENTVGYKKRTVNISELVHSDARIYGRGVSVDSVDRITNMFMYDSVNKQQSKESYLDELSTILGDVESIFYETDDSGLTSDLNRYFQSVEDLRSNPTNQIYINSLTESGTMLVQSMKSLYTSIEDRQESTLKGVYENVDIINSILDQIGDLNEQIGQRTVEPNDLLDKRDMLEAELSTYINIEVDRTNDYQLKIGGQVAVRYNTNIHNVKVVEEYATQKDVYSSPSGSSFTYYMPNGSSVNASNISGLVTAINNNPLMKNVIHASLDGGDFVVTSLVDGIAGAFSGTLQSGTTQVEKNVAKSVEAGDDVHIEIFDKELDLQGGTIRAMVESLDTTSSANKLQVYKDSLNTLAAKLSDMTAGYISNGSGGYSINGLDEYFQNGATGTFESIGLFQGGTVDSLEFNLSAMADLTQNDLDYLATLQWSEDIDFGGTNTTSFSKYYQILQVQIAADKESVDFKHSTQLAVTESLKNNYDEITKVDKDEEMIKLIQFQAAYEANAKLITMVDEMLQTILGMKR